MTKRMLIDCTHAEETRVVVLDGNRLEDFDVETAAKKQLKGNIYLAKVVRVEPSLQAAFVEYGGGRHGFLAFGEIHPDYYQIPVADRQRLLELQEAEARAEEEAEEAEAAAAEAAEARGEPHPVHAEPHTAEAHNEDAEIPAEPAYEPQDAELPLGLEPPLPFEDTPPSQAAAIEQDFIVARDEAAHAELPFEFATPSQAGPVPDAGADAAVTDDAPAAQAAADEPAGTAVPAESAGPSEAGHDRIETLPPGPAPESLGGEDIPADEPGDDEDDEDDDAEEGEDSPTASRERREARPPRYMRSYKIQEVIRRRQILLVQVVKEERGTKGAALTTFISLAGRFSVLMPNSPRGGGISRKITSAADRRRLKEVTTELQIPRGMGLIVRTAGANRPKAEIRRDCEYLLELWDSIRETTMASVAPALIHEEASLIKRSIRDNYSRDVDEVLVDGQAGWRAARDFMRMLMPAHARKVILWTEPQPLFAKAGVEAQLDSMLQPTVQLRSGGYLVINQTEALVAIDVNSGRSTRERGIEETALKTNLEAADEVARQLRLRDLAGLIVIDFIDMESRRNVAAVEKRMKDALRDDRARIQVGSISHFGLMELSRQRLRPSLAETSFTTCPHCGGTGHVRTTETAALAVLRAVEEEGSKRRAGAILVHAAGSVALYILNHKRERLAEIEQRYAMSVSFAADDSLLPPAVRIEKLRAQTNDLPAPVALIPAAIPAVPEEDDLVEEAEDEFGEDEAEAPATTATATAAPDADAVPGETAEEAETRRRRRRRRRRGGRRDDAAAAPLLNGADPAAADQPDISLPVIAVPGSAQPDLPSLDDDAPVTAVDADAAPAEATPDGGEAGEDDGRGRRRGRRGGRRRRRDTPEGEAPADEPASFDAPADAFTPPVYAGPTPANPFGGQGFDIFDILDEPDEPAPRPAPVSPEPPPVMDTIARPDAEAEAAEATVPAAEPPAIEAASEPAAEPAPAEPAPVHADEPVLSMDAEEVLALAEPPMTNGHATPQPEPAAEPAAIPAPEPEPITVNLAVPPPIVIGSEPVVTEKKRGWWRR